MPHPTISRDVGVTRLKPMELGRPGMNVDGSSFPFGGLLAYEHSPRYDRESNVNVLSTQIVSKLNSNINDLEYQVTTCLKLSEYGFASLASQMGIGAEKNYKSKIINWFCVQVQEWADGYTHRIINAINTEFRYVKFDFARHLPGLVRATRVRLLPILLAMINNENVSELATISFIPTADSIDFDSMVDDDSFINCIYYRRVHFMSIPYSGTHFVGESVQVNTMDGVATAYVDYKSRGTHKDYIVPGDYPGRYQCVIKGREYISYYHIDAPHSKTSMPHYRLSSVSGSIMVNGTMYPFPSFMHTLIEWLQNKRKCVLDALVLPIENLYILRYSRGLIKILNMIIDGNPMVYSIQVDTLEEFARQLNYEECGVYEISPLRYRQVAMLPRDYRYAYTRVLDANPAQ